MSFDWSEYLNLAEKLIDESSNFSSEEASYRAAISRAYYAAFCAARNFGRDRDEIKLTKTGSDHRIVKDHFLKSSIRERRQIGNWLNQLRDNRNRADYDDDLRSNPRSLAQDSVAIANNVLNRLKVFQT